MVQATPIIPPEGGTTYVNVDEATTMLTGLLMCNAARDATTSDLAAALLVASIDIDSAMRYQGRKCDPAQEREFPRVSSSGFSRSEGGTTCYPPAVKLACVLQADSILAGDRDERLAAIHDGVTTQSADGMQEVYSGETKALCRRAWAIMERYRLRSGALL